MIDLTKPIETVPCDRNPEPVACESLASNRVRITGNWLTLGGEWGPEIPTNRQRPDWLHHDERPLIQNDYYQLKGTDLSKDNRNWAWRNIPAIRLRADHPYYKATAAGFKYWPGGEGPPDDMGDAILFANGGEFKPCWSADWRWSHDAEVSDIIGYKPKAEAVSDPTPTDPPKTLRDEFAMAALTGLLAGVGLDTIVSIGGLAHSFALGAHEIADAMMAERRKGGEA